MNQSIIEPNDHGKVYGEGSKKLEMKDSMAQISQEWIVSEYNLRLFLNQQKKTSSNKDVPVNEVLIESHRN